MPLVLSTLAKRINDAHTRGMESFREAGNYLLKAKEQLKHGEWLRWLKKNISFSQETASRYMRLAELGVTTDLKEQWRIISGNGEPKSKSTPGGGSPKPPSPSHLKPFMVQLQKKDYAAFVQMVNALTKAKKRNKAEVVYLAVETLFKELPV
jgi:hypothetical protein